MNRTPGELPGILDAVRWLTRLSDLLEDVTKPGGELERLEEERIRAQQRYEVHYARVFLTATGSVDARKHTAVLECADDKFALEMATAKRDACRERIRTLRSQIDVGRSLQTTIRSELDALGRKP